MYVTINKQPLSFSLSIYQFITNQMKDQEITFSPYNWLGNKCKNTLYYQEEEWVSVEALFQAMRFNDETIRQNIRKQSWLLPLTLCLTTRKYKEYLVVEPMSSMDIENLRTAMELKFKQHTICRLKLLDTGNAQLIQFVKESKKIEDDFWGMTIKNNQRVGLNIVGKLLMEIREKLINNI